MTSRLTREENDTKTAKIRYVDTATAYDLWSEVYDTDGNFLQALDTIEMKTLLPSAVSMLQTPKPWKAVDLGCGTGRNTVGLLSIDGIQQIAALDLSPKMLDVAKTRLQAEEAFSAKEVQFQTFDMIHDPDPPAAAINADFVVSTLVLEHVPLEIYFRIISTILKPGGLLLMTNMHSEMGNISQAGFIDPKSGEKIRPVSYPHTVKDTKAEAAKHKLELVESVREMGVDQGLAEKLGSRGKKWVGVMVWFGGVWRKRQA